MEALLSWTGELIGDQWRGEDYEEQGHKERPAWMVPDRALALP